MAQPVSPSLAQDFLAALPESARARFARHHSLDTDLGEVWRTAAEAWPDVNPPPASFAGLLARTVEQAEPERLRDTSGSDQYLVAGCLAHQDTALRTFEREFFGGINAGLAHMKLDADTVEDVKQKVRERLYVAREDGTVPLGEYVGKGSLGSFIRVMATRIALNLIRDRRVRDSLSERQEQQLPDAAAAHTPELLLLKETHRAAFEQALKDSAQELAAEERNLLRLHLVDGLTIDELAALHRIHRATAARRVARVRTKIAERTRALLNERLLLDSGEFSSLVRLVQSRLDVSMRQILRTRS